MKTKDFINELVENGLDSNTIIDHVKNQQRIINNYTVLINEMDSLLAYMAKSDPERYMRYVTKEMMIEYT